MTVFLCEDTFEGILCGVYDAWTSGLGHENVSLELAAGGNFRMFTEYRRAEETQEKVEKVTGAIRRKAGAVVFEWVFRASLSCEEQKADRIYRFLVCAFSAGPGIVDMLQVPAVCELFQMERRVERESRSLIEFIRFSQVNGRILFGTVAPENDVIVLMAPHFADRLNGEDWVIYDERRRKAVVHRAMGGWVMAERLDDSFREWLRASSDQAGFESLWRTFHKHIAITERTNPVCQQNHLPLRYRPYMTEFQG